MTKKLIVLSQVVLVVGIILSVCGYAMINWVFSSNVPSPRSDVPVVYKIDWWPYQENISLNELKTKIVFDELNLFNATSVVEYTLMGKLSGMNGFRPFIECVHISERWEGFNEDGQRIASIVITPVVDMLNNDAYDGQPIEFEVSVQDYLESGGWGLNIYKVKALGEESEIRLLQGK